MLTCIAIRRLLAIQGLLRSGLGRGLLGIQFSTYSAYCIVHTISYCTHAIQHSALFFSNCLLLHVVYDTTSLKKRFIFSFEIVLREHYA